MANEKRRVNRYYVAILYPEDENYVNYMEYIKKNYTEVTYITHTRDIDINGETKKPHTHILFKVGDNARHLTRIAKEIGLPENYLQGCNKDAMLLYFLHRNNPEKTQYRLEEVKGELVNYLKKILIKQQPEEDKYNKIIMAILDGEIKNYTMLMIFCIKNGAMAEMRKAQYILCKMIDEKYYKDVKKNEND